MAPRLFVVLEVSTGEVLHVTPRYTSAVGILRSIPERVRDCFAVVRYDADENWTPTNKEQ